MVVVMVEEKKPPKTILSDEEWELVKRQYGYSCGLCGESERHVPLRQVLIFADTKGAQHIVPLCPNCQSRYSKGMLDVSQVKRLGLTWEIYQRRTLKKKAKIAKGKTKV